MKIGMTGTRFGATQHALDAFKLISDFNYSHAYHGGCVGADMQFDAIMKEHNIA